MSLIEEMQELESAEEFFEYLGVPYDPNKVRLMRTSLLWKFRSLKDQIDAKFIDAEDSVIKQKYADALNITYVQLTTNPEALQRLREERKEAMPEGSSCSGCSHEMPDGGCGDVSVPAGLES
ncbi:MAG: hypothetical protein HQK84_03810 [Nitrospinae bacterium]|nr:hypothetical protein [Nitrospinota bacterium]